jgi:hypothetical protein
MTVSVLGPVNRDANSGERDGRRVGRSANVLSAKLPQPPTRVKNGLCETNRILHRSGPVHTSLADESGGSIEEELSRHLLVPALYDSVGWRGTMTEKSATLRPTPGRDCATWARYLRARYSRDRSRVSLSLVAVKHAR